MNVTLIVLITYLIIIFLIAWYFSRRESVEGYFLNKKKTNIWLMTFSSIATMVGAGSTVAIVSEVYNSGISFGFAIPIALVVGMIIMGILAKKIKAIGDRFKAYTLVDFFAKRFDKKNQVLTGVLQIFLLIIWIGVQAIAIASLASVLVGVDYYIALFLSAIITILYISIGGLKIDIITDFIQFWIIMMMFIAMTIYGYLRVGGFSNLFSQLPVGHLDPFAFGGITWFMGVILISGFIYLGNTAHWQRILSAKNEAIARKSFFIGIPFVIVLGVLILFLGLVASVVLSGIQKETAIFALMDGILPSVLVGLGFAAVLAVIMSSIDSVLVGGSTIIYRAFFKKKKLFYARLLTAGFGVFGFLLAFLVPDIIALSLFVTYLGLIFVPAIFAAIYSKKTSSNASFYSILIPTIVLIVLFPILKEQTFVVTTLLAVILILFFDKIFRR
jgi:sodium/proline symporter